MSNSIEEEAAFADIIKEVKDWLDLKLNTGRYAFVFAAELAGHVSARYYNVHAIYDEIGVLEGNDTRRSSTKKATPFDRPPLIGLWHKHHNQARFLAKNLLGELRRPGVIEAACAPHIGRTIEEVAGLIAHELVIEGYTRRAAEGRVTGEFIVYEPQPDGTNFYLTLGSHGEYDAIRSRVDACKAFDLEQHEIVSRAAASGSGDGAE